MLSIQDLREILTGFSWIKVKKYQVDDSKTWEEKYRDLEKHHQKETNFLIKKIRELARELSNYKEKVD